MHHWRPRRWRTELIQLTWLRTQPRWQRARAAEKKKYLHHRPELSDGESPKRSGQVDEVSSRPLKGMETCEGLRVQIGLQKQLHEQLEIQRNLQLQVEEHSKYLAMMIAKQSESLKQLGALPRSLDAPTQVLDNRETSKGQTGDADSAEQKPEE